MRDVPNFTNGRGTIDNIKLIVSTLVLLNNNFITKDEIKMALVAYT